MFVAAECLRLGLSVHPVAAGVFRGHGTLREFRLVPRHVVLSMCERGVAQERFAWGSCSVHPGQLIVLRPHVWHDLTEGGQQPLHTLWFELAGTGAMAVLEACAPDPTQPVLTPQESRQALALLRRLVRWQRHPAAQPAAIFARDLYGLIARCASRRPRPAQSTSAEALVARADALWHSETVAAWSAGELAERLGVHPNTLLAATRQVLGMTAVQLVRRWRVERAQALLAQGDRPLKAVARAMGYRSVSHGVHAIRQVLGRAPRELRRPR